MLTVAAVIGYIVMFTVMLAALFAVAIGLPGTWVILAEALAFALITDFGHGIGWWDLLALLAMAGTGEVLEFVITARGAKKEGGSNKAMAAAIAGGLIGALVLNSFLPIIGALIGAFMGVYLGAFLITYLFSKDLDEARRIGAGAFMGRLGAVLVKVSIGVAMISVMVWQIFFT